VQRSSVCVADSAYQRRANLIEADTDRITVDVRERRGGAIKGGSSHVSPSLSRTIDDRRGLPEFDEKANSSDRVRPAPRARLVAAGVADTTMVAMAAALIAPIASRLPR
jgi:hypothetical protein